MKEFELILQSAREEDSQKYLTDHHRILLAAFGSHWAVNECIPKFKFGNEFVSDFVIVTGQSFYYDITLVELEPPTERLFTTSGKYAKRLNDAIGQINDWLTWIHDNNEYFRKSLAKRMKNPYGADQIAGNESRFLELKRNFVNAKIVIGRRHMLSEDDDKRRATIYQQTNKVIEIVPYDRLVELEEQLNEAKRD